jgi:hypothetical protein
MSQQLPEAWFASDERVNAAVAWLLTAALVVATVAALLSVRLVTAALAGTAAAVAVAPALVARSWSRTVPWPLLLLASLPLVAHALGPTFLGTTLAGFGVAALGMLLVVALQLTTSIRMTARFAIASVFLVTLAFTGVWALGSAASARYLGTAFLETNTELMIVFTEALLGGLVGGLVFRWFFRRQLRRTGPTEAGSEVVT